MANLGAYGFRLAGVDGGERWLVAQTPGAPRLSLATVQAQLPQRPSRITEHEADLGLIEGVWLQTRADSELVTFTAKRPLDSAELIHPFLAPVAALHWAWGGQEALHAGAVMIGGGAVLVLGDKAAGKSTTLGRLDAMGLPVMADDLVLVTRELTMAAGPRSIDRRPGSQPPGGGEAVTGEPVRAGQRWRQLLGPAPPSARLRGWVHLGWGPAASLTALDGAGKLPLLAAARRIRRLAGDAETVLDLAALPAYRLERPAELGSLDHAIGLLLDAFD